MIVIVGQPALRPGPPRRAGGLTGRIADAIGRTGRPVQLVGRVGDDPGGDELVLALAEAGVGHVALLRDASRRTPLERVAEPEPTDPADDADAPEPASTAAKPTGAAPAPELDAGDVDLGLRYLTSFDVLVVVEPDDDAIVRVAGEAAAFVGAALVVVAAAGDAVEAVADAATVLEAPADGDPDGAFATAVAAFAGALADGEPPEGALRSARTAVGG